MRLLVTSDSHRAAGNLLDIVELHLEDSDVLLFLGDGENDLENVRMLYPRLHILQVAGNCDWGSDLPAWGTAKLGGKTVLYTHGHPFHVKFGLAELEQAAREAHADICLFGHTHQQMTDYRLISNEPRRSGRGLLRYGRHYPRRHYAAALPVINTIFKEKRQNL